MSTFTDLLEQDGSTVLFLTNDFPPQVGGIQSFVRALCDELPPERVVVYAPRHERSAELDGQVPFTVVRDVDRILLPHLGLARRVQEVMRRHGVRQVVYGASVPLGLLAPVLRRAGAVRQVALTHGHEVWWAALPGTRQILRYVARHVDVMTYVSDYTRSRIRRPLSSGDQVKLVKLTPPIAEQFHPGVDGAWVRASLGIPPEAPVVVCVARLVRRKGQDRLIRIWPHVLRRLPHAALLVVGDGPDRRRLERMVRRRGLQRSVHLAGEVEDVASYYAAGDVFAMPVRNRWWGLEVEGLGISYLEAAACGLRVVGGRVAGAVEAGEMCSAPHL